MAENSKSTKPKKPTLKAAIKIINAEIETQADRLFVFLEKNDHKIMASHGVDRVDRHPEDVHTVAMCCAKDLVKLQVLHADSIEVEKFAGYMGFWIRKIKPYYDARTLGGQRVSAVNEHMSFWLAAEIITMVYAKDAKASAAIKRRLRKFFQGKDYAYVIESARHRTYGPHHYVLWAKGIINGS